MTETTTQKIILVSGACCQAHLAKLDAGVEKALAQALSELGMTTPFEKVSLSALLAESDPLSAKRSQLSTKQHLLVLSLFNQYGASFAPAVIINDQVRFVARVPKLEDLKTALKEIKNLEN